MPDQGYADLYVTASDGLRLYARDYGPRDSALVPVVCLPGLSRHSEDFHALALRLSRERWVLALDYRGRGRSGHDPDWRNYSVPVELGDVLQVLIVAGIEQAIFVGTSRGGIITMALSAARQAAIRAVVLNDIGPVVEAAGLSRIRGYVGKLPAPRNEAEGAALLRNLFGAHFPRTSDDEWRAYARGTWREVDGKLVTTSDPALQKTLEDLDLDAPIPPLWHLFEGLKDVPVLLLRGEHSDLLSAETAQAMGAAHPNLESMIVPDQGHAPLLQDEETIERIAAFVTRHGASREPVPA